MKNMSKITTSLRVLLVSGFLLSTSFLMAQSRLMNPGPSCEVTINNGSFCPVQLDIYFSELVATSCVSCPGSPVNIAIPAGSAVTVFCDTGLWSCTGTVCDITATLTNGNTGTAVFNGGAVSIGLQPGCHSGSPTMEITYNLIDIKP